MIQVDAAQFGLTSAELDKQHIKHYATINGRRQPNQFRWVIRSSCYSDRKQGRTMRSRSGKADRGRDGLAGAEEDLGRLVLKTGWRRCARRSDSPLKSLIARKLLRWGDHPRKVEPATADRQDIVHAALVPLLSYTNNGPCDCRQIEPRSHHAHAVEYWRALQVDFLPLATVAR